MNNVMNNQMIVLPVMTPYGTQLVPMSMSQLLANQGLLGDNMSNLAQLTQLAQQQMTSQNASTGNMQQLQRMQAALLSQNLNQSQKFGQNLQTSQNPIVSSILQQQAQILRNHQKISQNQLGSQNVPKVDQLSKSVNDMTLGNQTTKKTEKKNLGAIGDFRPVYRSQSRGQSSGFSSGNNSESDSASSSTSSKIQLIQNANGLNLKQKTQSITTTSSSHFSSNSSGWSESGSGDEFLNSHGTKNATFKLLEQRSGSKALFLQKMVEVLDSYFSDEGLKRNQFLAKQLQLNPQGIPLKKVAGMRRVKALTRDLLTVASAVRRSPILELSRDGYLVTRTVQPSVLEPPKPIRTVLAINLDSDNPTVESVTSQFAKYGELTQVRVIRPTSCLPNYLKEFVMWVPDLGHNVCAVIEFETQEEAQAACRDINMANRDEGKLRVALLKPGARIRRTLYRKYKGDEEKIEKPKGSPQVVKIMKNMKVQSDSGNGSDGSNEASTENSEDENVAVASEPYKVITRRSWMTKTMRVPAEVETTVLRQPVGPVTGSRGFHSRFSANRRMLLA